MNSDSIPGETPGTACLSQTPFNSVCSFSKILIAQEVQKYIPEVVKTEPLYDKEYKGIDYGRLVTVLIGAVQEQQKEITELKEKVAALEAS